MLSNQFFKLIFILIVSLLVGCQTTGTSKTITNDISRNTPKGPSGKIKYNVPKNIDLTEIINGKVKDAEQEEIYGRLLMPKNFSGKIPAVIIMHASGGVFDWREKSMAKLLNKNGIAAFIPYSFAARGFYNTKSTQQTGTTFGMRVADALSALVLLSTHPDIDKNKIGVMGYSSGGFASLLSIDEKVRVNIAKGDLKFAAHVNVYAASILTFKEHQPTKAPMLFLMGEKDNTCPKERVLAIADEIEKAGGNVKTIFYPGAHHVFDAFYPVKSLSRDNDGGCQFQILNDGYLYDGAMRAKFSERELYGSNNIHINPCKTDSVSFGRNNFAAKQYKTDALNFFLKSFSQ